MMGHDATGTTYQPFEQFAARFLTHAALQQKMAELWYNRNGEGVRFEAGMRGESAMTQKGEGVCYGKGRGWG